MSCASCRKMCIRDRPYNASGGSKEYRAELFLMPKTGASGVKSDYACLTNDRHYTSFSAAPVTLIEEADMTIAGIPDGGKIYMVKMCIRDRCICVPVRLST